MHYANISGCDTGEGFIVGSDWGNLKFNIVGDVAVLDGDIGPATIWVERIGARFLTPEEITAFETAQYRVLAKVEREKQVSAIKVTISTGKTFDGDEQSQTRMARAIIGLQAAGIPSLIWILADNTVSEVTIAELTEAMILSGQAQAAIWVI